MTATTGMASTQWQDVLKHGTSLSKDWVPHSGVPSDKDVSANPAPYHTLPLRAICPSLIQQIMRTIVLWPTGQIDTSMLCFDGHEV